MNQFALAASLLLWGWHTQRLPLAVVMLAIVGACGLQSRRWHLGDGDWQRVLLVSAVLLIGATVYAANVADLPEALFVGIGWLPPALFPLIVMQRLSADPGVPLSVFLAAPAPGKYLDFALPFAAATLLAAASANTRSDAFFPALIAAFGLALWPLRRPGAHPLAWLGALSLVAGLGLVASQGLSRAQAHLEDALVQWLSADTLEGDSDRSVTRIGTLGRIKLSGKVVLRVRADTQPAEPIYLVEATYDEMRGATWLATDPRATALGPGGGRWDLGGAASGSPLRIEARLGDGKGVLPLPFEAARITGLPAQRALRNRLGSVRIEGATSLIAYGVESGAAPPPPGPGDLVVPPSLAPALKRVDAELQLSSLPAAQRVGKLEQFFNDRYRYTLDLGPDGGRTLTQFLTTDREGHCEYFASATALLLRRSGVPARYAVGYLAHDYSGLEQAFLVRSHDAHAWVMAWIDGAWRIADTTPGNWPELEARNAPFWDPLSLLASRAWFAARAWWQEDPAANLKAGAAGLVVALGVLIWLWRKQRSEATRGAARSSTPIRDPLAGTAFAAIARRLQSVSPALGPHETPRQWANRAALHARVQASGPLDQILALHYQQRYDPSAAIDGAELARHVDEWAERFDHALAKGGYE